MQFGFSRVDDHLMFREALAALLSSQPDMNLIAEAANGRKAIQQFRAHQPDITLTCRCPE
jgi:DNA-binding NarL/FixJ family response regulator